jgi:putative SOS response-associated peptidase YedK
MVKQDLDALGRKYGATWVRQQIDDYLFDSAADPKRFPPLDSRIFPGYYAPVLADKGQGLQIELMRYSAYPPARVRHPQSYTTYNARRDNLSSAFWSEAFMCHHGFVVLERFYEWVLVEDLLQAGVVTLEQVTEEFRRQAAQRQAKIIAAGKKYKPTPTEQTDPRRRRIIIEFRANGSEDLTVPVIFSQAKLEGGRWDSGFAIITDLPPQEVMAAGHDRCPVVLESGALQDWLHPDGKSSLQLQEVLGRRQLVTFQHQLPGAA